MLRMSEVGFETDRKQRDQLKMATRKSPQDSRRSHPKYRRRAGWLTAFRPGTCGFSRRAMHLARKAGQPDLTVPLKHHLMFDYIFFRALVRDWRLLKKPAQGSACFKRDSKLPMLNSAGSRFGFTSLQANGVDTGARGRRRTE